MKNLIKSIAICAVLGAAINLKAQTVTVSPTALTLGYMNWSPVASDAGGYGGSGSSAWGLSDLQTSFSGSTLTIQPNTNTYAPGNPYWVNADGSGANYMDANIYNESSGTYVGTTLTFTYNVLSDSLTSPYISYAFIKDFVANYSSFTSTEVPLALGVQSISLLTSANATDNIQYGFETYGPDTQPGSTAAYLSAVIAPVPEPTSLALIGLGILGAYRCRRARAS
jgi:hypothetical protein